MTLDTAETTGEGKTREEKTTGEGETGEGEKGEGEATGEGETGEGDRQGRLARPQKSTRCGGLRPREPREGCHTFTSTSDDTIGSGRTR